MQPGSAVCRFLQISGIPDYEWWLFLSWHYISHYQRCFCEVSPIKFTFSQTSHLHKDQDQHVPCHVCLRFALCIWIMVHHPRRSPPLRCVRHALPKAPSVSVLAAARQHPTHPSFYDFNPNIRGWKRRRGRPKTRWADSINHDLNSAGIDTTTAAQMVFNNNNNNFI